MFGANAFGQPYFGEIFPGVQTSGGIINPIIIKRGLTRMIRVKGNDPIRITVRGRR